MWSKQVLFAVFALFIAGRSSAQITPPPNYWSRGTELGVTAGGATSASGSGPMGALRIGWDVTRWVSVDGRGVWIDEKEHATTVYAAALNGVVNLIPKQRVTPFVGAGFGLYHPAAPSQPTFSLLGGVDVITSHHWTIRPEATVLLPRGDGSHDAVFTAGISIGYRFEDHLVTP